VTPTPRNFNRELRTSTIAGRIGGRSGCAARRHRKPILWSKDGAVASSVVSAEKGSAESEAASRPSRTGSGRAAHPTASQDVVGVQRDRPTLENRPDRATQTNIGDIAIVDAIAAPSRRGSSASLAEARADRERARQKASARGSAKASAERTRDADHARQRRSLQRKHSTEPARGNLVQDIRRKKYSGWILKPRTSTRAGNNR